jgi:hypothetical protein
MAVTGISCRLDNPWGHTLTALSATATRVKGMLTAPRRVAGTGCRDA